MFSKNHLSSLALLSTIPTLACQTKEEQHVAQISQAVISGDEDFSGLEYMQYRTVQVRQLFPAWLCGGVPLLPNVILTARHCITDSESVLGSVPADPAEVRVRVDGQPHPPSSTDLCTGPNRVGTCAVTSRIHESDDPSVDMVLLELEEPLSHEMLPVPFTQLPSGVDETTYIGSERIVSGRGRVNCDDSGGIALRWGSAEIIDVDDTVNIGIEQSHLLVLGPGSTGQNIYKGDSGGPTWGDEFPHSVIGIHSVANCVDPGPPTVYAWDLSLAHPYHFEILHSWMNDLTSYGVTRNLSGLDQVELVSTTGSPTWAIVGSELVQTANAPRNFALIAEEAFHGIVDQTFKVTAHGPDDDGGGIVFNYVDTDNYLYCSANEQLSLVQLVAQHHGSTSILSSTPWSGDFSQDVTFQVLSEVNAESEIDYTCRVTGGGTTERGVSGQFASIGAGRAGVFNHNNQNLAYRDFSVKKTSGNDCSEISAVDMGAPGTSIDVPNDGCLKITQYPGWWGTRQMQLQHMTGSSYPVPFEWSNSCGAGTGGNTIQHDWHSFFVNGISDACTTLIDLNGPGDGNVQIRYYAM